MIFLDLWLQDKGIIHTDHFTEDYLPKGIKTVVQNEEDEQIIRTIACLHFQIASSSAIAAPYHSSCIAEQKNCFFGGESLFRLFTISAKS